MGSEPTPTNSICSRNRRRRNGLRNSHAIARPRSSVCSPAYRRIPWIGATAASSRAEAISPAADLPGGSSTEEDTLMV